MEPRSQQILKGFLQLIQIPKQSNKIQPIKYRRNYSKWAIIKIKDLLSLISSESDEL